MNTELETIMLCLQRRYNILREIGGLTDELAEAVERRDDISASLLLKMRGEQMERHAACQEELICLTEQNPAIRKQLQAVALGPIEAVMTTNTKAEADTQEAGYRKKIYEIRSRTQSLIDQIRSRDSVLARSVKHR